MDTGNGATSSNSPADNGSSLPAPVDETARRRATELSAQDRWAEAADLASSMAGGSSEPRTGRLKPPEIPYPRGQPSTNGAAPRGGRPAKGRTNDRPFWPYLAGGVVLVVLTFVLIAVLSGGSTSPTTTSRVVSQSTPTTPLTSSFSGIGSELSPQFTQPREFTFFYRVSCPTGVAGAIRFELKPSQGTPITVNGNVGNGAPATGTAADVPGGTYMVAVQTPSNCHWTFTT